MDILSRIIIALPALLFAHLAKIHPIVMFALDLP
jgi:hypothetical protein